MVRPCHGIRLVTHSSQQTPQLPGEHTWTVASGYGLGPMGKYVSNIIRSLWGGVTGSTSSHTLPTDPIQLPDQSSKYGLKLGTVPARSLGNPFRAPGQWGFVRGQTHFWSDSSWWDAEEWVTPGGRLTRVWSTLPVIKHEQWTTGGRD